MHGRRSSMLLVSIVMVCTILACSTLMAKPALSNIRMTTDETGATATGSYSPGDTFFVFADLSGLSTGSVVEARWFAVNADGMDANSAINTSDYTSKPGVDYISFQLTTAGGGNWPAGSYRVELYLNGTKVGEQGFTVQ